MPWPALVVPTPGTVITTAWESAMVNDPLLWLRLMTGNADPPGSSYVVVSSSTSATAWGKVTADVIAAGAVTPAKLDTAYLPLTSGTLSNDLYVTRSAAGLPNRGYLVLGNNPAYYIGFDGTQLQLVSPTLAIASDTLVFRLANPGTGYIGLGNSLAHYIGFDPSTGVATETGRVITVGNSATYCNAATAASATSATSAGNAGTVGGLTPGNANGNIPISNSVTNVNLWATRAANLAGFTPSTTSVANAIPVADASGKLDAWVTPTAAAPVPSGLIAFINTGSLPSGWAFYPAANGRVIVAAGTASVANAQTFAVNSNYGGDWAHAHTTDISHAHAGSGSGNALTSAGTIGVSSGGAIRVQVSGTGTDPFAAPDGHGHGFTGGTVTGSTAPAGSSAQGSSGVVWIPPSHALNAIIKS